MFPQKHDRCPLQLAQVVKMFKAPHKRCDHNGPHSYQKLGPNDIFGTRKLGIFNFLFCFLANSCLACCPPVVVGAAPMLFFSFFKTLVGKEVVVELKNGLVPPHLSACTTMPRVHTCWNRCAQIWPYAAHFTRLINI